MTKMIDRATGVSMWVADNRVEEYLAAGHTLAASVQTELPVKAEKKSTRKKTK